MGACVFFVFFFEPYSFLFVLFFWRVFFPCGQLNSEFLSLYSLYVIFISLFLSLFLTFFLSFFLPPVFLFSFWFTALSSLPQSSLMSVVIMPPAIFLCVGCSPPFSAPSFSTVGYLCQFCPGPECRPSNFNPTCSVLKAAFPIITLLIVSSFLSGKLELTAFVAGVLIVLSQEF